MNFNDYSIKIIYQQRVPQQQQQRVQVIRRQAPVQRVQVVRQAAPARNRQQNVSDFAQVLLCIYL